MDPSAEKLDPDAVDPRYVETIRVSHETAPFGDSSGGDEPGGKLAHRVLTNMRATLRMAGPGESIDGRKTADFLLDRLIGAGGMGLVYEARQTALERTVAIKVLRHELVPDADACEAFLSEALVAADLDHPNTVPIYQIGRTDSNAPFYAMKLVSGVKWNLVLPDYSLARNLQILLMVADAVAFAHDKGIIHRDLKPENVMIGRYGEVLLLDWGLAGSVGSRRAPTLTEANMSQGSPPYLPPEVANSQLDRIGIASDIYLLGGMLYQIVTGVSPHGGATLEECIAAARENVLQGADRADAAAGERRRHGELQGSELLEIARLALSTEPALRHPNVKAFSHDVRQAMTHIDSFGYADEGRSRFEHLLSMPRDEIYREFDDIITLYQKALAHWPGNTVAAEDLIRVRQTFAAVALRRGDIHLARSQVRTIEQECQHYHLGTVPSDEVAADILNSLSDRDRSGR